MAVHLYKLVSSCTNYFQWYIIVSWAVSFDLVSTLFFLSTKLEKVTIKQGPQITWCLWFVYFLIDCSLENVISSSDYTVFDGRIINELEVAERKWPWPNETLPQYLFGDTEENHFNLSHVCLLLGWDFNLGSTEYEARVLPNWLQHLVLLELYTKCKVCVDKGERTAHNIPLVAALSWFSLYKNLHLYTILAFALGDP